MRNNIVTILIAVALITIGCQNKKSAMEANNTKKTDCSAACEAKSQSSQLSCKLTTPELQQRKATILESLRKKMIEKKELPNGYAYRFSGTDEMVDELTDFIKTERECCDFFTFNLSISGDKSEAWLELKGAEGAKEFIKAELEL